MDSEAILAETREQYGQALVAGELSLARAAIETALSRGVERVDIYLDVFVPAQIRLGELWRQGMINVAQEHLATSITIDVMNSLRQGMKPQAGLGMRAVVTPVEGEPHWIGARMIADFLAMDGWDVDFLWTGTPAKDLAEYVQRRNIDLVALSATQTESLPNARAAAEAIRERNGSAAKILLGGRALDGTDLDACSQGCDAVAGDALQALTEARQLVGLTRDRISLEEQLALMGQRIREARSNLSMTQQALGEASGLDRTYISLVERGKQNLTIGAALKIAHALDVPVSVLLERPNSAPRR